MKRRVQYALIVIVPLAHLVTAAPTKAYDCTNRCTNGRPPYIGECIKWSGPFNMYRDRCSFPDNTVATSAYLSAGDGYAAVMGQYFMNNYWWYEQPSGCPGGHGTIDLSNGRSETAMVDNLGPNTLGLTTSGGYPNVCITSPARYSERDVRVVNSLSFSNQDESFYGYSDSQQGAAVLVHEFGHALGLAHMQDFTMMHATTPLPLVGGSGPHAVPYPDDAAGARWLYGITTTRRNVFASALKYQNDAIMRGVNTNPPDATIDVCRGCSFSLTYSAGNNGNQNESGIPFRIFIVNSVPAPLGTAGVTLWSGTLGINAGRVVTETRNLTVPASAPLGLNWIFWALDENNTNLAEFNETDNIVHSSLTINVTP